MITLFIDLNSGLGISITVTCLIGAFTFGSIIGSKNSNK